MRISYYVLVWQAILMFLAGIVSVGGSLAGYLSSGGGDELLQQALVSFFPQGNVRHEGIEFDRQTWSRIVVRNLRSDPIVEGQNSVQGLVAERCEVNLDLWPWPPRIDSVHVFGMRSVEISVQPGYLQDTQPKIAKGPPFPVYFHGITAGVKIGNGPWLKLEDCSGVLKQGLKEAMIGEFSLSKLNGKPFEFTIASLGEGRWESHGRNLEIDTQVLHVEAEKLGEAVDPVTLLLRALLTGEMGAKGAISSLRVAVQPGSATRPFLCEGQVGYQNLELHLPQARTPAGAAVPTFLRWMFFSDNSSWPTWLQPDSIRTGAAGTLTFHMHGNRLEFACDEGAESAFMVGKRDGAGQLQHIALESLKGSLITDESHRPHTIVLRGILGGRYNADLRMDRNDTGVRTFELLVDPRAPLARDARIFDVPLWRFRSRVEDYGAAAGANSGSVRFEVEFAAQDFPYSPLLPPGVRDVSGRMYVRGRYGSERVLDLEEVTWKKGALTYGGQEPAAVNPLLADIYGRVFESLKRMWGGPESGWTLQDIELTGKLRARFNDKNEWTGTELSDWKLANGVVSYKGTSSDFGAAGIEIQGHYLPKAGDRQPLLVEAGVRDGKGRFKWSMRLEGVNLGAPGAEIRFIEDGVPLKLHPERESIPSKYIEGWIDKTVKRTTIVRYVDGKPALETSK